jgi:hypothetical protein
MHSDWETSPTETRNTHKPVSRLSEQTGLPSRQTGLQADLPGLGFDLHPNPSPSLNKPVGAGASPFGKPKSELSASTISRHLRQICVRWVGDEIPFGVELIGLGPVAGIGKRFRIQFRSAVSGSGTCRNWAVPLWRFKCTFNVSPHRYNFFPTYIDEIRTFPTYMPTFEIEEKWGILGPHSPLSLKESRVSPLFFSVVQSSPHILIGGHFPTFTGSTFFIG